MGKKKPQKTKELSVAISEASSTGNETQQHQQLSQTPRKRGRPRKIVEKSTETKVKKEQLTGEGNTVDGDQSKRIKTSKKEEEEEKQQQGQKVEAEGVLSTHKRGKKKESEQPEEKEPPRRSRRRKSQPRKSY